MSHESPSSETPAKFPVTVDDRARFHGKPIRLERVPVDSGPHAGTLVSGPGTLYVFVGEEGWAEIHMDDRLGPITFGHHVLALGEEMFRRVQETPEGLFLRGEG